MLADDKVTWMEKLHGNILVVDDCYYGRNVVRRILRGVGYTVEVAENGQVACQRALGALGVGRPFDLIITDMDMPVMDGYSATTHLRERGYSGRIIALTANSNEEAREQCYIAGCDDFATKPITLETLLELVKRNMQVASSSISFAATRNIVSAARLGPVSISRYG